MGNLFATLLTSAGSMRVFERALNVVQNNVSNATTPGYARQRLSLEAMRFQPEIGYPGGIQAGELESLRSEYAERAVWRQQGLLGEADQSASNLSRIEGVFPVSEGSGIHAALDSFFKSFSNLSVAPNNTLSRQSVIDSAGELASVIRDAATQLATASTDAGRQLGDLVEQINGIGDDISKINAERRWNAVSGQDAGLDARLHSDLESLAELTDFTAITEPDGSTVILIGGQTPLVMGEKLMPLNADLAGVQAAVMDSGGRDITASISMGRLASVIRTKNDTLPTLRADFNRLAETVADVVNGQLRQGLDYYGQTPVKDLFTYDTSLGAATSLSVTDIQPQEIAAAADGAPGGNGNALMLAGMATSRQVNDFTFAGFYGRMAANVGRELNRARAGQETETQLVAQARSLREEISAVSLDEEAATLIQFQRGYEASARLITVLNELTETLINLIR